MSLARSLGPISPRNRDASLVTPSRMLRCSRIRASREARSVLSLSPNKRSNNARGLRSMGSGVVGLRQESVLR